MTRNDTSARRRPGRTGVPGRRCLLAAVACGLFAGPAVAERVTDPQVIAQGRQLFEQHCAACHGSQAQGPGGDWKQPGADGRYPPPPLNGTAHAWHHPFSQLHRVVKDGTARLGGSMPAWGAVLDDREIDHVLHYIISLWPEAVFRAWEQRGGYQ